MSGVGHLRRSVGGGDDGWLFVMLAVNWSVKDAMKCQGIGKRD